MPSKRSRGVGVLGTAICAVMLIVPPSGHALSVDLESPAVGVTPNSGLPGSQAAVSATGFGACPETEDAPPVAVFTFDGNEVARELLKGGNATGTFTVPDSATPGAHQVSAICLADPSISNSTTFTVTSPTVSPVLVPELIGSTAIEAERLVAQRKLQLVVLSGEDGVVVRQDPAAGTEVGPDSVVGIVLGGIAPTPVPSLVVVPNLVDRPAEDAEGTLLLAGLELGTVSGSGNRVASQAPGAGSEVPAGSAVDLTLSSSTTPGPDDPANDVDAETVAGTDTGTPFPTLPIVAIIGAVLLGGLVARQPVRRARERKWVRDLRYTSTTSLPRQDVREPDGSSFAFGVRPRPGEERHSLEEVPG